MFFVSKPILYHALFLPGGVYTGQIKVFTSPLKGESYKNPDRKLRKSTEPGARRAYFKMKRVLREQVSCL